VGKPLGNGHPMGMVVCTREIAAKLKGGYFSTFGGNPVSCAVGSAVLDVVSNEKLVTSAGSVGRVLGPALNAIKKKYPMLIGDVRGTGLMWAVEFTAAGQKAASSELARHVMNGLRMRGVLVAITGGKRKVMLITPPMCFHVENAKG